MSGALLHAKDFTSTWNGCMLVKRENVSREEYSGRMVDAFARFVCGNHCHVQAIHLMELLLFGDRCPLHARDVTKSHMFFKQEHDQM